MSDLSDLGMTVVAVIHQPRFSAFALFDVVSGCQTMTDCMGVSVAQHSHIRPNVSHITHHVHTSLGPGISIDMGLAYQ